MAELRAAERSGLEMAFEKEGQAASDGPGPYLSCRLTVCDVIPALILLRMPVCPFFSKAFHHVWPSALCFRKPATFDSAMVAVAQSSLFFNMLQERKLDKEEPGKDKGGSDISPRGVIV